MKLKNKVRQKLNRIWWYSTLLFRGDDLLTYKSCDYLIIGHDHDKSLRFNSKKCSPILDFLEGNMLLGRVEYLGKPGSKLKLDTFNSYKRVNIQYLLFKLLFILKGTGFADRAFWRFILKKTKPKCVLGIQIPPLLCMEATLMDIETINVQHGMIQSDIDYYKSINSDIELPSIFYCWDNISIKIARKKFKKQAFKEIGHPWHNQFLKSNYASTLYSRDLNYIKEVTNEKIAACISLQYDSEFNSNLIPKQVIDKLNHLKSHNYIFLVRFHPIAILSKGLKKLRNDFYENNKIKIDDCNIVDASCFPLPLLLPFMDVHLTKNSAVFLESQLYGIKTYYWDNDPDRLNEIKDYESLGALLFPISDLRLSKISDLRLSK